jgi:DNA-binding CsgD family transcriptional regulator
MLEVCCNLMRRAALSTIELEILKGLANGMQSKELAATVGRSTATVELYVRTLLTKFDARSRAQLVASALCDGAICKEDVGASEIRQPRPLMDSQSSSGLS